MRLVDEMTASMQHEKFYTSGTYSAPELGVFASRIALPDSFSDAQPIENGQGSIALLLSGECFSDPVSCDQLGASGHEIYGHNAGRLVSLYEASSPHFFANLNGLFSGLLIDRRQRKVFLFNDRYGMERIYYHEGRDGFFFASEAKALLRILPELRAFDKDGLAHYLQYGCTLEWSSLFRGINILPGASLWSFDGEKTEKRRYFSASTWESQQPLHAEPFAVALKQTFTRLLPRYLAPEEEIGISLTGGLDTRMIMACRPEIARHLVSYTFAGLATDTLDARLAARVAAAAQVPHHVLRIDHDFFSDFASLADRTVYITDGCLGVCGSHEIYLNRKARELSRIRLTGNFGSEILRSATTFKPINVSAELLHPDLRPALYDNRLRPSKDAMHPVSFAALREIPWHLFGLARAAQSQLTTRTPYLDNDLVALAFRAPGQSRRSSTPALHVIRDSHPELARIPTDSGLVPASRFSSFLGSLWYRPTFKLDYWRNVGFPKPLSLIENWLGGAPQHRYLHYRRWFRTELAGYLRERLSDPHTMRSHLWNRRFLQDIAEGHVSGRNNYLREIDTVLTYSAIEHLLLGNNV